MSDVDCQIPSKWFLAVVIHRTSIINLPDSEMVGVSLFRLYQFLMLKSLPGQDAGSRRSIKTANANQIRNAPPKADRCHQTAGVETVSAFHNQTVSQRKRKEDVLLSVYGRRRYQWRCRHGRRQSYGGNAKNSRFYGIRGYPDTVL